MSDESIKGSAVVGMIDDLRRLVQSGEISRERLEQALAGDDLRHLEEPIEPSLWYSVESMTRITNLLEATFGDSRPDYAREAGEAAVNTILAQGGIRRFVEEALHRSQHAGSTLIGLASLVYNFGEWRFYGEDLSRFRIEMHGAKQLPDFSMEGVAGFVEGMSKGVLQQPVRVTARRDGPDVVVWEAEPAWDGAAQPAFTP